MAICWERPAPLAFHLCCFDFSADLVVRVPFPFGVSGRVWNSIVSVPDNCLFIFYTVCPDLSIRILMIIMVYIFDKNE